VGHKAVMRETRNTYIFIGKSQDRSQIAKYRGVWEGNIKTNLKRML